MEDEVGMAPDGSPVEVYLRLPTGDEPEVVHRGIPEGASILELGCGTGRITRRLAELGHPVTAVDQSAEMLEHVRGAETVLGNIEDLDLGRRFEAVVLASHLINSADPTQRSSFLNTCRNHVDGDGVVLIQRYEPDFDWRQREDTSSQQGGVVCTLRNVSLDGRTLRAVMEYRIRSRARKHAFTAELLSDEAIERDLARCDLRLERWIDDQRSWLTARPVR
jgi:SAM-dependent methyltransferase